MRVPLECADKCELESKGLTLEAAFIESDSTTALVFVYRVDLTGSQLKAPPPVVKFSEGRYAIHEAKCIQLATPEYYRNFGEGEGDKNIRDEQEAIHEKRANMGTFLAEHQLLASEGASNVSLRLRLARNGCWIFCTSVKPTTDRELQTTREACSADYDCTTTIANPSEFAKKLGAVFAAHSQWSDVRAFHVRL